MKKMTTILKTAAGDDVYLFNNDEKGETITINSFGDNGIDRIYFAEKYELVALGDKNVDSLGLGGDASKLEIFYQEKDGNVHVYVEAETFGGNASSDADITEIVLTGVTAAEFGFADGYITVGTAAETIV